MEEREKSGQLRGSFAAAKRPLVAAKVLAATKDPHAAVRPRGKVGPASGSPWRSSLRCSEAVLLLSEATIHRMEMLCFCFDLFFRCFEDLSIALMRTR